MAYAVVKSCGRVLLLILLVIQLGALLYSQITGHANSGWLHLPWQLIIAHVLFSITYSSIVSFFSVIFLVEAILNDRYILSRLFFGWKLYIGVVFVPYVIDVFGITLYFDEHKIPSGMNGLMLTVCATPILLLLLLITADDSFSSKNHRDLVRNLSILIDLTCWIYSRYEHHTYLNRIKPKLSLLLVKNGKRISIWNVPTGKTVIPFQNFCLFREFPSGMNRKNVYHLHPNRNFWEFVVNGKQP